MKIIAAFLLFSGYAAAQQSVSTLKFLDTAGTASISVKAPGTLGASATLTLPVPTGSTGCLQDSTGGGLLVISACPSGLTPPVTISGTTSGNILTVTQSGSGNALVVNGAASVAINSSSANAFTVTQSGTGNGLVVTSGPSSVSDNSSNTAFSITESGAGDALHVAGSAKFSGLIAQNSGLWSLSAIGLGFAQDYTSRYVFNSIGDVPQTGSANTSGFTFTATSGSVDASWKGGQILICPGGCTGTNGALYLISNYVNSTTLTLATSPGTLTGAGYSYQANAFQTSTGTMYCTGTGFCYEQNLVVTNELTALGGGVLNGTITCSGTACNLVSGDKFNLSMELGTINIIGSTCSSNCVISAVTTDHTLTLTTSAGSVTGVSFSYSSIGLKVVSGGAQITGNALFNTGIQVAGGSISITSPGSVSTASGGFNAGSGGFTGNGNISGTHLQNVGTSDNVVFNGITVSGLDVASGISFMAGPLTVASGGIAVTGNSTFATGILITGGSIVQTSAGSIFAGSGFGVGSSLGVSCSGSPTASFASIGGIVTHC